MEKKRGHLKIFFGYAAGVGKTYAMLQAALAAREKGTDTVIGSIAPHTMPETSVLAEKLEHLEGKQEEGDSAAGEFDLDAAILRRPQLILVDELACINPRGRRHARRYQDVEELLKAGIDVYTTVNAHNIESLSDVATKVMGCSIQERIPDDVFDQADQVELIDIEPQELMDRLHRGMIDEKREENPPAAAYFSMENLTALREIAMRRCADRINRLGDRRGTERREDPFAEEHILVCLSAAPSNSRIVRTAARLAQVFHGNFTALFVKTPEYSRWDRESTKRLQENIRLAEQLGAKIEVIYSNDIPFQIAEFARLSGVTKIVMGRSAAARHHFPGRPSMTEKLILNAPNLDVYIIPDAVSEKVRYREGKDGAGMLVFSVRDILKSAGLLIAASLIGFFFYNLGIDEANIITIYVLSVLLTALVTENQIYSLISAAVSVLVFNFMFTEPRFSLQAYDAGYPLTFGVMFLAAFITGSLVMRLKSHARQSAGVAFRTRILFDTNRLLQQAREKNDIIQVTASQLMKLLNRNIVIYPEENGSLGEPRLFFISGRDDGEAGNCFSEKEQKAALWTFKNNKHSGASTDTFSDARCMYLAIRVNENVYGVLGIVLGESALEAFESSILLSVLGECALALENEKHIREKEAAAVMAQNEQLRANLLRAISHDLRTPLTSISGNAGNLLSMGGDMDEEMKRQLYTDIYEDSLWLINTVENLLSITRLVGGQLNLNMTEDLIEDVVAEALQHVNKKSREHQITVEYEDEFMLAKMDSRLIVQVIINIVNNAVEYTPQGSHIQISVKKQGNQAVISVADDGDGLSDEAKKKVFDMFYSGENKVADSRRSCGIGLSLCQSIVRAHGGEIFVSDHIPHGAVFTFTLPSEEVRWHE